MIRLRNVLAIGIASIIALTSITGSQAAELPATAHRTLPTVLGGDEKDNRDVVVYKTAAGLSFWHPNDLVEGWCYTQRFDNPSALTVTARNLISRLTARQGFYDPQNANNFLGLKCVRVSGNEGWLGKGVPWMPTPMTDRFVLPAGPSNTVLMTPIFVRGTQKGNLGSIKAVSFVDLPLAAFPSAPTRPNWAVSGTSKLLRWSKPSIEGSAPVRGYFVEGGELNKGKIVDVSSLQTQIAPITGEITVYEIAAFSEIGMGPKVSISVNPTTKPTFVVPLTFLEVRLGVALRPAFEIMAVPAAKQVWKWHLCEKTSIAGLSAATVGKKCKLIATAKGSTYSPLKTDLGKYIAATVTSTNTKGSTASFTFGQVKSFFQGGLEITPALVAGGQYSLVPYGWLSSIKPTVNYQWVTCNSAKLESVIAKLPSDCIAIKGATRQTFTPGANLRSHLAIVVTATDKKYGTVIALSPSIELVVPSN